MLSHCLLLASSKLGQVVRQQLRMMSQVLGPKASHGGDTQQQDGALDVKVRPQPAGRWTASMPTSILVSGVHGLAIFA